MSMKSMLDKRSSGQSLLHGSDVPDGIKTLLIEVETIEPSPDGFDAPAISRFRKPVYGKSAWAVNKTNMKMLIKLYGDDEEQLVGKKIKLEVILVRNPQTGENVRGLAVSPKQK
jgi:hypothetical protein